MQSVGAAARPIAPGRANGRPASVPSRRGELPTLGPLVVALAEGSGPSARPPARACSAARLVSMAEIRPFCSRISLPCATSLLQEDQGTAERTFEGGG